MAMDSSLSQLHPAVHSNITSDETLYRSSSGVITLFASDVFEKGPDNTIEFVGSKEEFLFKYGEPNYTKYGQTGYNIVKFLESGGQAYIQRVLPNDASYAHSVVNVQTKVKKNLKKIKDANENLVTMDDVFIRPTSSFIKRNNVDKDMLISELNYKRSDQNSVDGYSNNFLLMVYPYGRGEAYNDLGFRLSLNPSFDNMYDSRVYNFEVIRFDENTNIQMIEGPFYVSFDNNALDNNNSSLYIEEVINRQSKYLNVKFNYESFENIAKLINPNVSPGTIDILSGQSKKDLNGKSKTYFCQETNNNEDIHVRLHKYSSNGDLITRNNEPVLNLTDSNDTVQKALISLDNGLRENDFNVSNDKYAYMKQQFPKLRSDEFKEFKLYLNEIIDKDGAGNDKGKISKIIKDNFDLNNVDSTYSEYFKAKDKYVKDPTPDKLIVFKSYVDGLSDVIRSEYLNEINKLNAAYTLTLHSSPTPSLQARYELNYRNLSEKLNNKDQINIFTVEHQGKIFSVQSEILSFQLGNFNGDVIEGMSLILNDTESEINYVYESLLPVAFGSFENVPKDIMDNFDITNKNSITYKHSQLLLLLSDIQDGLVENSIENRTEILSISNENLNRLTEIISDITFESNSVNIEAAVDICRLDLYADAQTFKDSVFTMIKTQGTYDTDAVIENARNQIQIELSIISSTSSKFFNTNLIDFSNPIKLLLGSDGSFTYLSITNDKVRNENIKRHLIKAYTGTMNPEVLNSDIYRWDVIFDARYDNDIKLAISNLARNSRRDFIFLADTAGSDFSPSPEDTIKWRQTKFNVASEYVSIFSQDLIYYDEFTGRDLRMTPTYILASKIPNHVQQHGLHMPLAGPRRGAIDGFKELSWAPNSSYRERLYNLKVNYIQQDPKQTRFMAQNTTLNSSGPLSQLNNMFTVLNIKRNVEDLVQNYIFELNDAETLASLNSELNKYLNKYLSNRSCEKIGSSVSASEYDKQQRIIRVNIDVKFTGVIERVLININVEK